MGNHSKNLGEFDTFPKLLIRNSSLFGQRPANREKDLGIWLTWTWEEISKQVQDLACGLKKLGLAPGDKVIICGDNRPHLYWAITAVQALKAVPVPVYQDSVAEEMKYIYQHTEAKFAIVENQEQVDKILEFRDELPELRDIIYSDPRGMLYYQEEFLHDYNELQKVGQ
ncbi:MAG: AMP-binding protein, partial [Pseudomonadota bacterium]|nr:AMP-binding protein [Pseudomonadota bacterium]